MSETQIKKTAFKLAVFTTEQLQGEIDRREIEGENHE